MTRRNPNLLFNYIFLPGILLLYINDHYWKEEYANWLTGKLSDFIGLLIFPLFLQYCLPRLSGRSSLITGLGFIFWKSPLSTPIIIAYNWITPIPITRTVDYTDLTALSILPLAAWSIRHIHRFHIRHISPRIVAATVAIPAAFIFMATSPPVRYYMPSADGTLHIGKSYRLKISRDEALARLAREGWTVQRDSAHDIGWAKYYSMNNVILNGGKDTIESIQFGFHGEGDHTLLLINNIRLKPNTSLRIFSSIKKYYRRLIRENIVEELR